MVTVRRSSRLLELERESVTILGSRVTLLIQLLSPYSPLPSPWYSVQWCFYRYSEFNFAICVHLISLAILCVKYLFWLQKFFFAIFFYRWYGLVRWYHRSPNDCLLSYPWVTFPSSFFFLARFTLPVLKTGIPTDLCALGSFFSWQEGKVTRETLEVQYAFDVFWRFAFED